MTPISATENSPTNENAVPFAASHLRAFVERVERLHEERDQLSNDIRDVYAEAKSNELDVKTLKALIRIRRQDAREFAEQSALLQSYMTELGMKIVLPSAAAAAVDNSDRWEDQEVAA